MSTRTMGDTQLPPMTLRIRPERDLLPIMGSATQVMSTGNLSAISVATTAHAAIANRGDTGLLSSAPTTAQAVSLAVPALPGDYNGNGTVDAADYVVWRKTFDSEDV